MAGKELTIIEKLKGLYDLQLIDSQIDEIAVLKGELPVEVSELEDEIAGLGKRIDKLTENVDELNATVAKYNANIKESEGLIERYEKQLEGVKNNREYDALMKELELQKLEIQLSEKRTRETQANVTIKDESLAQATEKHDAKNKALEAKKVELEKIIKKTDKEEAKLKKSSKKARVDIEDRLLKAYDKTRTSYRNGLAVVTVSRNSCGGCFNQIPPQLQLEISQRKKIIACEHCGRVLVDDETAAVETS